jgi:hypothetical protein
MNARAPWTARALGMAERVGFEPTVPQSDTTVFETVPFNHSGTSPSWVAGDVNAAGAQGGYHASPTVVQAPAAGRAAVRRA